MLISDLLRNDSIAAVAIVRLTYNSGVRSRIVVQISCLTRFEAYWTKARCCANAFGQIFTWRPPHWAVHLDPATATCKEPDTGH